MKRQERDAILRQGIVLPETPRDRRQRAALQEDLESSPLRGRPLRQRLRNFQSAADGYLVSVGGPLPYMVRLREIERMTEEHERALGAARAELAAEHAGDPEGFAATWREVAGAWGFDEVNDLIARHNRWYPAESRLPMDPRTRDFARVNGRDYRLRPLDAAWVLERFPPRLPATPAAKP